MDKKPENTEPKILKPINRGEVVNKMAEDAVGRIEDQRREDRKYALGSKQAKPSIHSSEPIERFPEVITSTPQIPQEETKGY